MGTHLWRIDRTGDQLATDSTVNDVRTRESMVDAAADLSQVEIKVLFGGRRSISCPKTGWVLLTSSVPADAVLAASLSGWTEDDSGRAASRH